MGLAREICDDPGISAVGCVPVVGLSDTVGMEGCASREDRAMSEPFRQVRDMLPLDAGCFLVNSLSSGAA